MKTKRKLYCDSCDTEFTLMFKSNKSISVCPFCAEEIAFIDEDEDAMLGENDYDDDEDGEFEEDDDF